MGLSFTTVSIVGPPATSPPPDLFERVLSRHRRPDRNRADGSALVALTVMAVVIGGLLWSVTSDTVPASGGVTGEAGDRDGCRDAAVRRDH